MPRPTTVGRTGPGAGRPHRRPTPAPAPTPTPTEDGMTTTERIAYFNGRYVPESQVLIPFRDRGFKYGDAVFDTTRTFGHRVFKLSEHVDRLYRSLRYLRIDPGLPAERMIAITEEVLA